VTVIIFTGPMISESALPLFGIQLAAGGAWRMLHTFSANLFVPIIGLHVALHWHWIVNTMRHLFVRRPERPAPQLSSTTVAAARSRQEA
jgi:hypothetical protein